jgi:hypothetical protein
MQMQSRLFSDNDVVFPWKGWRMHRVGGVPRDRMGVNGYDVMLKIQWDPFSEPLLRRPHALELLQ